MFTRTSMFAACAVASGLALGCRDHIEAGLYLVFRSEMAVPADLDGIEVQAVHAQRGEVLRTNIRLAGPEGLYLPTAYSIAPSQSKQLGPYRFRIIGKLQGKAKTLYEFVSEVPRTRVAVIEVPIQYLCYDQTKVLDSGEVVGLCPQDQTCIAGQCRPMPVYDANALPAYSDKELGLDPTATCYDARACFASPGLLLPDLDTCRVKKPEGTNLTVGLLLPLTKPGVLYRGRKLIVFDADGLAGYSVAGDELQLPVGICNVMRTDPNVMLLTSTTCLSKRERDPLCRPAQDGAVDLPGDWGLPGDEVISAAEAMADGVMVSDVAATDSIPVASGDVSLPDVEPPDATPDARVFGACESEQGFSSPGSPCDAGGICNGVGGCGSCLPGQSRCLGRAPQTCSAMGTWATGLECKSVCEDGACTGICAPGTTQCKGKVQQTCDPSGQYVSTKTCPYVCLEGACSGSCVPDSKDCSGNSPRVCNASGEWVAAQPCQFLCNAGVCVGECTPGDRGCQGTTSQTCSATATWAPEQKCTFACTGAGQCTGECVPGNKACSGTNVQTCSAQGQWFLTSCPAACVDGHCSGTCVPGTRRCTGQTPQVCDAAGNWQSEAACSRACTGAGVCDFDSVVCWGDNTSGQATPKPGIFTAVAAGTDHSCGVRGDGTVDCWGSNTFGQASPKPGTYLSISAGNHYTCGIRTDGTLDCWGLNSWAQATPRPGQFASVSAGNSHTCGVQPDGSLTCWGYNSDGRASAKPGTFVYVSARQHTCAIRANGSVECWGLDLDGRATPKPGSFSMVSVGERNACGRRADGTVECWGDDSSGQSTPPPGAVVSLSVGKQHACALRQGGAVECWGDNTSGQSTPKPGVYVSVSAGDSHSCAVRESR